MTSQVWNITYQLWMDMNEALHSNSRIHILSGLDRLKDSISSEYSMGLGFQPTLYRRYFTIPHPRILNKSPTYQKRWFLVIRSGREATSYLVYNDNWHTDKALRRLIGLLPNHT